jgi:hypothetical protein
MMEALRRLPGGPSWLLLLLLSERLVQLELVLKTTTILQLLLLVVWVQGQEFLVGVGGITRSLSRLYYALLKCELELELELKELVWARVQGQGFLAGVGGIRRSPPRLYYALLKCELELELEELEQAKRSQERFEWLA